MDTEEKTKKMLEMAIYDFLELKCQMHLSCSSYCPAFKDCFKVNEPNNKPCNLRLKKHYEEQLQKAGIEVE